MSKAKGVTTIHGKEPVLKMITAGVEFDGGELYFDRMGRIARLLYKSDRGWLREPTIAANQSQLMNPADSLILSVSPKNTTVTLNKDGMPEAIEEEDVDRFAKQVEFAFGTIIDELEIEQFQRAGYRENYKFACETLEETEEWIRDLGLYNANDTVHKTFGKFYASSWSVICTGEECRYRIALLGTERPAVVPIGPGEVTFKHSVAKRLNRHELLNLMAAKRHRQTDPEYAVLLDIDAFLWGNTDADFNLRDFITRRAGDNLKLFRQCVPKKHE